MEETAFLGLLRQVPFLGKLDETMLAQVASCATGGGALGRTPGTVHEGDPGQTLSCIVSGRVAIQKASASGQTVHLAERGAGEHIGELALIDGQPMADAVTVTPCDLLMLDREEFVRCIESSPPIALTMMAALAEQLREAADDLEGRRSLT